MATTFGQFIMEKRIAAGLGLREMCLTAKQDPSNYSKYERGLLVPTKEEDLARIARALKIKRGTADWGQMLNLASTGKSMIPADFAKDARVLELLPALYQKLRGFETPGEEDPIDALVRHLRKEAV